MQSESMRAYKRKWYQEHKAEKSAYMKMYNASADQKLKRRARTVRLRYGISVSEYDALIAAGTCEICGARPRRLCLDHDHAKSGAESVRGVLCVRCNVFLDWFEKHDRAAHEYLKPRLRVVK